MRCGIIVHTETGHTGEVARRIAERLRAEGHDVDLKLVRARSQTNPFSRRVTITRAPETDRYDLVILGSPVRAFSASPAILAFLRGLESLEKRRVIPFVTKSLPGRWTGGSQALDRITSKLEVLGAMVGQGYIVHWLFGPNHRELASALDGITAQVGETH